jgi:acyl transferase domain-containing protein
MNGEAATDRQDILRKALSSIRTLRAELDRFERDHTEPIAIVGIGCRFPGNSDSPEAFWRLLHDGVDAICEPPPDRWDVNAYYDPAPDRPGKIYTRAGGFLCEDVSLFDNEFFHISPREALSLDPQQRLLLEVAWETLERAAQARQTAEGAVFIGISTNDYAQHVMFGDPAAIDVYAATGNALNAAAGRLAYHLGFQGPAVAVDTACSSSLVAVHLACQSLRARECSIALAGGVNLMLTPHGTIATCRARMLAPDGRCKTFDASADGYVRGEGCALIALKRLSDAETANDSILALIIGSAVNQDGSSSALTVPNGEAQRNLLRRAMAAAKVQPADFDYIEAHGTGTPLGDPIEFDALRAVFGTMRVDASHCAIGSVKTNIGHLEAAAGIAGLIKVILALNHNEIAPNLHFRRLNPQISMDGTPFFVPTMPVAWQRGERTRIAGVSSFGFTGTNSHVVLQEGPPARDTKGRPERGMHILALSARNEAALGQLAGRFAGYLDRHPDQALGDVCFTANAGRPHHAFRLAVRGRDHKEIAERLRLAMNAGGTAGVQCGQTRPPRRPKIAFLCSGQGAQFAGMGRQLYEEHPAFRTTLNECTELLRADLPEPLTAAMFGGTSEAALLNQTLYTQPAVFALGCALVEMFRSWGVEPTLVMGHSLGEYVAAYTAGVFELADGLKLVARRARLMAGTPGDGSMVSVFAPADRVREWVQGASDISIAAYNGPTQTVISGRRDTMEQILGLLDCAGVTYQRLRVSHAFHSPLMDPMLAEFEEFARTVTFAVPRANLVSNVTGLVASADEIGDPTYWRRHVRQPVEFQRSIGTLRDLGCEVLVEIGPGGTLSAMGQTCAPGWGCWRTTLRRGRADWDGVLETVSELYVRGCDVDWSGFDRDYSRRRVALPTYPFQRKRYWPERTSVVAQSGALPTVDTGHPFLGRRKATPLPHIEFESEFNLATVPIVGDHRIHGTPWVNLVVYLEAALAALGAARSSEHAAIRALRVSQPLILPERGSRTVEIFLTPSDGGEFTFQLFSLKPGRLSAADRLGECFTLHCSGTLTPLAGPASNGATAMADAEFARSLTAEEFYRVSFSAAVQLGPLCKRLDTVRLREGQAFGTITPGPHPSTSWQILDLGAVDACVQLIAALVPNPGSHDWLITEVEGVRFSGRFQGRLSCLATREAFHAESGVLSASLRLFDERGRVPFEIERARLERIGTQALPVAGAESAALTTSPAGPDGAALLALPDEERELALEKYLVSELARALGVPPESIDREAPLSAQLDSLIAAEIKTLVERDLNAPVPVAPFFDGSTIREFSRLLLQALQNPVLQHAPSEEAALEQIFDEIEHLADEKVLALATQDSGRIGSGTRG